MDTLKSPLRHTRTLELPHDLRPLSLSKRERESRAASSRDTLTPPLLFLKSQQKSLPFEFARGSLRGPWRRRWPALFDFCAFLKIPLHFASRVKASQISRGSRLRSTTSVQKSRRHRTLTFGAPLNALFFDRFRTTDRTLLAGLIKRPLGVSRRTYRYVTLRETPVG